MKKQREQGSKEETQTLNKQHLLQTTLAATVFGWGQYDIMKYQRQDLRKASADKTDTRFDKSWYYAKTEFSKCSMLHFLNNLQKKTLLSDRVCKSLRREY